MSGDATEAVAAVGSSARRLKSGNKRRKLFGGGGKHAKNMRDPLRSFRGSGKKPAKGAVKGMAGKRKAK